VLCRRECLHSYRYRPGGGWHRVAGDERHGGADTSETQGPMQRVVRLAPRCMSPRVLSRPVVASRWSTTVSSLSDAKTRPGAAGSFISARMTLESFCLALQIWRHATCSIRRCQRRPPHRRVQLRIWRHAASGDVKAGPDHLHLQISRLQHLEMPGRRQCSF
jgi:hypothetical protein